MRLPESPTASVRVLETSVKDKPKAIKEVVNIHDFFFLVLIREIAEEDIVIRVPTYTVMLLAWVML